MRLKKRVYFDFSHIRCYLTIHVTKEKLKYYGTVTINVTIIPNKGSKRNK